MQVMQQPSLVISHSQLHMTMLHWQTTMPFIMQQQLHMLPASILHMFCKVAAATSSSQVQVILNPSLHFSIFMVQRGTMHICMAPAPAAGIALPDIEEPIEPIMGFIMPLSIIIMLAIRSKPVCGLNPPSFRRSLIARNDQNRLQEAIGVANLSGRIDARLWLIQ
jgi:hypothetical protein